MPPVPKHSMQPARTVIDRFGGSLRLARILNVDPSTVCRWAMSSARRGTDGRIPQQYWGRMIVAAQDLGFTLTATDLSGL